LDWRTGEVSNWLTIPLMLVAGVYALSTGGVTLWIFLAALVGIFALFYFGNIGGADAKILSVLAGLWPSAFIGSILVQGVWGLVILLQNGRYAKFRAIPSYAIGTLFSMLVLTI